ncbi:MAG TPA: PAS domain S-box protein [Chthonomonadaceae bacterium]|nr:PAS domain S-box protein [Chthonomonadaceae bacterium]
MQELQASALKYHALFDTLPVGVVVVAPEDASFVAFNDAACANLGYTPEEFARLTVTDIQAVYNRQKILELAQFIAQSSDTVEFETQHRSKSGEVRNVLVTARRVHYDGRLCLYGVWQDITARRQAEQPLLDRVAASEKQGDAGLAHQLILL